MKKQKLLSRDDLDYYLHVALRKCCDSPQTSIAWNIIDLMTDDENTGKYWSEYLDSVYEGLVKIFKLSNEKKIKITYLNIKQIVSERSLYWRSSEINRQSNILMCSFRLFTDGDWSAYINAICDVMNITYRD